MLPSRFVETIRNSVEHGRTDRICERSHLSVRETEHVSQGLVDLRTPEEPVQDVDPVLSVSGWAYSHISEHPEKLRPSQSFGLWRRFGISVPGNLIPHRVA
jgi:hypothetical protein